MSIPEVISSGNGDSGDSGDSGTGGTALVKWKRDAKDGKNKIQGNWSKPKTVKVKK